MVSLTWVLFRALTFTAAGSVFTGLFRPQTGRPLPLASISLYVLAVVVFFAHLLALHPRWPRLAEVLPSPVRGLGYAAAITAALLLAPDAGQAFIYFQF